jgi:phosphatidate cytidylyltransferase
MGIVGQVGDLVESLIKRVSDVADSSNIIPGQGGLLDTLDSFIYTAPLLYLLTTFRV